MNFESKTINYINEKTDSGYKNRPEVQALIRTINGWLKDIEQTAYEYGNFSQAIITTNTIKTGPLKDIDKKLREDQRIAIRNKKNM